MGITGHRSTILLYSHLISPSLGGVLLRNRPSDQPVRFRWRGFDLKEKARWRTDIESLVFPIRDHAAMGAVHRGAFRTLLGVDPTPQACLAYFEEFEAAFRAAGSVKIARKRVPAGTNYHVTSCDVVRKLIKSEQIEHGEQQ